MRHTIGPIYLIHSSRNMTYYTHINVYEAAQTVNEKRRAEFEENNKSSQGGKDLRTMTDERAEEGCRRHGWHMS